MPTDRSQNSLPSFENKAFQKVTLWYHPHISTAITANSIMSPKLSFKHWNGPIRRYNPKMNSEARSNLSLKSDPACIAFRSLSIFRYLGSVRRLGAGGAA
ncbi:hypothetical protein GETHLI_22130 [Geothrix limicola]|uniref:Uncharacterized protein n=1 Tax=Geothrix limicola TaxID=2927978 RepID=A0ABQ5QGQ2_9BACT|nr:hypothetical protein GETHLI_22130 [Geothrix limicola]